VLLGEQGAERPDLGKYRASRRPLHRAFRFCQHLLGGRDL